MYRSAIAWRQFALTLCAVSLASLCAGHALAQRPAPGPLDRYSDRKFTIEVVGCKAEPVTVCTVDVTPNGDQKWDPNVQNVLVTWRGEEIPATMMTVGSRQISMPPRSRDSGISLRSGIPTRMSIQYQGPVNARDIAGIVLYVGHWTAQTITLKPKWPTASGTAAPRR